MSDLVEINVQTGEVVERDFTEQELKQRELDRLQYEAIAMELKVAYDQELLKRNSIVEKLILVGLTEEEADLIVPQVPIDDRIKHLL